MGLSSDFEVKQKANTYNNTVFYYDVETLLLQDNTSSNFKLTLFLYLLLCWAAQSKDQRFIITEMIALRPKLLIIEPKVDSDCRGRNI